MKTGTIGAIARKEMRDPVFFPRVILIFLYLVYLNLQLSASSLSTALWTNSFMRSHDTSVPVYFVFILLILASDSVSGESLEEVFCACDRKRFILSKWVFLSLVLFALQLPFIAFYSIAANEFPILLIAGNFVFILAMVALGIFISLLTNSTLISALLILIMPGILSGVGDQVKGIKYFISPEYALQDVYTTESFYGIGCMLAFTLTFLVLSILFSGREVKRKRIY